MTLILYYSVTFTRFDEIVEILDSEQCHCISKAIDSIAGYLFLRIDKNQLKTFPSPHAV